MKTIHLASLLGCVLAVFFSFPANAAEGFDFTRAEDCAGWQATHDVSALRRTSDGLEITISGDDPYINGPARDYGVGKLLWMTVRLRSEQEGMAQVFYFDRAPTEEHSVRFAVRAGEWQEVRLPMPAFGGQYRLRFDPPGTSGRVVISKLAFAERVTLSPPLSWNAAAAGRAQPDWHSLTAGETTLLHGPRFGEFELRAQGKIAARGMMGGKIGYVSGGTQRWMDLSSATHDVRTSGGALIAKAVLRDADDVRWILQQRFTPNATSDAVSVATTLSVERDREVAFVPMLMIFPGAGPTKTQALFPGLEYLDGNESSSSEADVVGPGSKRQTPDTLKVTIPMMTIAGEGVFAALAWSPEAYLAPLFDSPDRIFGSDRHVMGVLYPGSSGNDRVEGNLLPHGPVAVSAGANIAAECILWAGRGSNCVTAVQQYVKMHGLPSLPRLDLDLQSYARLAAAGWLDSEIRDGNRFRHAWPGDFRPQPAADAAWMMDWLAAITRDQSLATRLTNASAAALSEVRPEAYNGSGVSHVRYPVASLLYGGVAENVAQARASGRAMLKRFEPDGSVIYRPGKVDYGKTHFAKDANGLTAQLVSTLLEQATVCGDAELIREGLRVLRAMDKFMGTAPRGAQTWECPLHTPDILASAHLVKAYVIGYELTGDEQFLSSARYWAWTGVPFVYLVNPASREVGPYATIAVYGATSWVAPNWMGLPVQWCGLVYADALHRLAKQDGSGPWKQLADGIVISGIQQTFPIESGSRKGLLPDSYVLRAGLRQNPAINPGTVQAPAMRYFGRAVYDFAASRQSGLLVHAPGQISEFFETDRAVRFRVTGVIRNEARVLVTRCKGALRTRVNGRAAEAEWLADCSAAVVLVSDGAAVEITVP